MFGRDLLNKGLKRQIGLGMSTLVWSDPWIFDDEPRSPFSPNIQRDLGMKVCDLIDPITKSWKRELVHMMFSPRDAAIILQMRPVNSQNDSVCWAYNRDGKYSVRSGYWLINRLTHKVFFVRWKLNLH